MILQALEGEGCQSVLCGCAGVDIGHKEVPVVQADLEDLILIHKGYAEEILQTLKQEGLVLRLLQHADLSLRMSMPGLSASALRPSLQWPGQEPSINHTAKLAQ